MAGIFGPFVESWRTYSPLERRNIALYILGIVVYKFGLEAFNGSIVTLATNRYDYDAQVSNTPAKTFQRVGLLTGLNQACQCVGSIMIAPLIKVFPTKNVLSCAVLVFGIFSAILLMIDAATGGTIIPAKLRDNHSSKDFSYYGDYQTDGMIPVYCVTGVAYGMVELIRRVIPRDIVGGNVQKLRRLDAMVHVFYEVSGTAGAFCTALALIPQLGNNYSFLISPICFAIASIIWFFVSNFGNTSHDGDNNPRSVAYCDSLLGSFMYFAEAVWTGARIIFTNRKFIWLVPGYSVALYAHRYLENGIAPAIAKRYLGVSAWSQIMVGGSNMGELLGALFVFLFTNRITTPIPWLRIDALMLLIVWYLPFWRPPQGDVSYAWIVAATFIPLSFGWAAGDVSLAAYIQATLARVESKTKNVSALGAVMAFLYCTYIVIYAITSPLLGSYLDSVYSDTGGENNGGNIYTGILNVAGVQFTLIAILILASTLVPQGALSLNPKLLFEEVLDEEVKDSEYDTASERDVNFIKNIRDSIHNVKPRDYAMK
jgi:hypothetical protein